MCDGDQYGRKSLRISPLFSIFEQKLNIINMKTNKVNLFPSSETRTVSDPTGKGASHKLDGVGPVDNRPSTD